MVSTPCNGAERYEPAAAAVWQAAAGGRTRRRLFNKACMRGGYLDVEPGVDVGSLQCIRTDDAGYGSRGLASTRARGQAQRGARLEWHMDHFGPPLRSRRVLLVWATTGTRIPHRLPDREVTQCR